MFSWIKANKYWLIGAAVCAAAAYSAGRLSGPTRVETIEVEKIVEKEVVKRVTEKGPVRYKKVVVEKPGAERVTTVTVDKDPVVITVDRDVVRDTEKTVEKIVEREGPKLLLGPTLGASFPLSAPSYGGVIGYRTGPVWWLAQGEGNAQGGSARVGVAWSF